MSLAFVHAHDCSEPQSDAVWGVTWTQTDSVISISADGSIKQFNSSSGQVSNSLQPHTLGLVSLDVDPLGRHALYNTLEGLTCFWDLESGNVLGRYESYTRTGPDPIEPAWSVSLHPKGGTYAATGGSGNITIHSAEPSSFAMSSETGQVYIFDLAAERLLSTYTSHAMAVRSFAWSPDSQLLVSASEDKRLTIHDVRYNATTGKPGSGAVATLSGHSSWVLSTDVSPDGRLLLSGGADKAIKVWDLGTRTAVSTIQDTGEVWSVSWRPKPPQHGSPGAFVTGGEDGILRWWRGAGGA
ncbi:hypothetical protein NLI96_g2788 [Meripilus lineatus]|uniref:WD repeat-containing protein 61 n=1 Tax=Meripilus lineatus TaxID=2056292 RepID=A0AAD5VCP4_9APHY|nr:hypothetical protein NLI96_g2788 [Physisporinus lineatus]